MAARARRRGRINGSRVRAPVCGLLAGVGVGGTFAALLAGWASLAPSRAWAGNQMHPRTPVVWSNDVACARNVDPAQTPILTLRYTIPYEDTEVTEDETDDSRTHQFLALCREPEPGEKMPDFVSQADAEAAIAIGVAREVELDAEDVLETSPRWSGCWHRITSDDARRPITFDAASEPVHWDIIEVPAGVYGIYGFTHEPPFSLWRARPGFVRIGDAGPGAAVETEGIVGRPGDPLSIAGCMTAGAEARLQWGSPGEWHDDAAQAMVEGEGDAFRFHTALPEGVGEVHARVLVSDPEGEYVAHMRAPSVLLEPAEEAEEGEGDDVATDDDAAAGGCAVGPRRPIVWALSPLLLPWACRRRDRRALRRST